MMAIRKWILLLVLFNATISLALSQRDSISIDPRWHYWHVDAMAPDGDWAFVYKIFPNDRNKNKGFVIHTDTKKRIEVTGIQNIIITANDVLIGTKGRETIAVDLKHNANATIGVLKQQDWNESEQLLVYITDQGELNLKKYGTQENKVVWSQEGVDRYSINPSKTHILYQREGGKGLYVLDLKTKKETYLLDIQETLGSVTWNLQDDVAAMAVEENQILVIDLRTQSFKYLALPDEKEPIKAFHVSFFTNNDLYISYTLLDAPKDAVADYLDIWNGNDRELKYKVRPRLQGTVKGFIYYSKTNHIVPLPRRDQQEYLNIGIPGYLLVYDPLELQDYTQVFEKVRYRLWNLETNKEEGDLTTAASFENLYNRSPDGTQLLYPKETIWEVYDFKSKKRKPIAHRDAFSKPLWSLDSQKIFFQDGVNLLEMAIQKNQTLRLTELKGHNRFKILNLVRVNNQISCVDENIPMIFSADHEGNKTSYTVLDKGKSRKVVDSTSNRLNGEYLQRGISKDAQTLAWTEENYNQPQTVKVFRKGKLSTLLEPEVPEELYSWRKQKVIHYKDKYGVDLTGVLWYPKDFDKAKKYPMVTWIYQRQGSVRSVFEIPSLYNQHGFNRALMTEQGYFVFQPDTYVSEEGAGLSALECVTKGIENITALEPAINKSKLGLIGHSFGGYETSFILGNSKLFAAGVSGAGIHDLIHFNYSYNYQLKMPNWFRVEGPQQEMRVSFADNPDKYYQNSPIHFAHNFETPVLLWTGMQDENVPWEQTRHMFIALLRYQKKVIALFYKEEEHSLSNSVNKIDLWYRIFTWFGYYLRDNTEVKWINERKGQYNYESKTSK